MTGRRLAELIVEHERLTREGCDAKSTVTYDEFIAAFTCRRAEIMAAAHALLALTDPEPILGHDPGD